MTRPDPGAIAADYLLASRGQVAAAAGLGAELAGLRPGALAQALSDDGARIAFWVDVYNATVLQHRDVDLTDRLLRVRHFRRPLVAVAGRRLSLDAIEHGLLRRSRWKLALGYLGNPLPSRFEREQRVARLDPRIHFALNCGAVSCPPIAAYRARDVEAQLDLATRSFLAAEVHERGGVLRVPAILWWYIGDFGGPRGVRRLLREHGIDDRDRPIRPAPYDWSSAFGHGPDDGR